MTIQLLNICKAVSGKETLKDINWEISDDACLQFCRRFSL